MIYKKYGKTGIDVSAIGFGGMRFADQNDVESCASLVKYAYDQGVNYFDTAPGYGKSEELFGVALKEMKKTRAERPFYISTKSSGDDPSKVRRDLETSLSRMGLDSVDFFHSWCVMSMDAYNRRKNNAVLKEFEKLRDEGLIRNICVSTHMTGADAAEMIRDYQFAGILIGYSVMNFAYRDLGLDAAAAAGCGVTVMNPLGGGVIPREPERFSFVKTRDGETVVEGALRFLINDPRITIALVGFSSKAQVDEAVRAAAGFRAIPEREVLRIKANLKEAFNQLCTGCTYCDDCPQDIPIPKYLEAFNHQMLGKGPQDAINRLRWHWGLSLEADYLSKCTGCGLCEKACTQKLPIRARLKSLRDSVDAARKAAAR